MLKEKDKKIHQEIERLKRLRSLLKNTMNITLDSFNVEIDKITFTHKEEEYFIVTEGPKTLMIKLFFQLFLNMSIIVISIIFTILFP